MCTGDASSDRSAYGAIAKNSIPSNDACEIYDRITAQRSRFLPLRGLHDGLVEMFPKVTFPAVDMSGDGSVGFAARTAAERNFLDFVGRVLQSSAHGDHLLKAMRQPLQQSASVSAVLKRTGCYKMQTVTVELADKFGSITFQNNHFLNAEDQQHLVDFETAVDALLLSGITVGVLRGGKMDHPRYQGLRVFSSGLNLKALKRGEISLVDFLVSRELGVLEKIRRGLFSPDEHAKTSQAFWIGVVDSFAIGGGLQILLVLDYIIAIQGAYASLPAATEGLLPGGALLRLEQHFGRRQTKRLVLAGGKISTEHPLASLLFDEIVGQEDADCAISRASSMLSAPALLANRQFLVDFEEPVSRFREYMARYCNAQGERLVSRSLSSPSDL